MHAELSYLTIRVLIFTRIYCQMNFVANAIVGHAFLIELELFFLDVPTPIYYERFLFHDLVMVTTN